MRYIFLFLLLTSCKKDNEELKVYYPNGNLNYSLIKVGDTSKLMQYDENGKLYLSTKFYKDHFIDTIKYNERSDIFNQSYSLYDSVSGPYFYHTRYVIFRNKGKTLGTYRYKRNIDFKKILNTEKPIGKLYNYDRDGQLTDSIEAKIIHDTVYYFKIKLK